MLDVYFEKHMDHAKVIKDRYLYIDQPERIDFIYSMDGIPDDEGLSRGLESSLETISDAS